MAEAGFTVLTVCTGNVNRSALAASLLTAWSQWYLPANVAARVRVESAGLGAPVGSPMGARTLAIAERLGVEGSTHRARQITEAQVRAADLVLVSSTRQRGLVLEMVPAALRSTFTIREAGRIVAGLPRRAPATVEDLRAVVAMMADNRHALRVDASDDIVDPQGKDDAAFLEMAHQEVPALARVAAALFAMPDGEVRAYIEAVELPDAHGGRAEGVDTARGRRRA